MRAIALLGVLGVLLSFTVGCSSPPKAAVVIGWDATDSAREAEEAHFQQLQHLLSPRTVGGPLAIVHICPREGHLLYGAEKPKLAEAKARLQEARTPCSCASGHCGSDVANGLRVMLDFLEKQPSPRKIVVIHSDMVSDRCLSASRPFDDCTEVDIPAGVEVHVYGLSLARAKSLAGWKKRCAGRICLHLTQEAIEPSHLGLAPSGVL